MIKEKNQRRFRFHLQFFFSTSSRSLFLEKKKIEEVEEAFESVVRLQLKQLISRVMRRNLIKFELREKYFLISSIKMFPHLN